jgi:lipid II:glycine glycyltransferase (peptidoglycan interpeptide bridge formation enzyme)
MFQTREYLRWHQAVGTKTFYKEFFHNETIDVADERDFQIDDEKEFENVRQVDAKVAAIIIKLKIGNVLYVPYGPTINPLLLKEEQGVVINKVLSYLKKIAIKENCVFVRMENFNNENMENKFFSGEMNRTYTPSKNIFSMFSSNLHLPNKKTFAKEGIFQPRVEWWLGLNDTEENIYNNFHKDHRYSIRRAQKENIEVEIVDKNLESYFEEFWKLMKITSDRDGFSLYDKEYYQAIFSGVLYAGVRKFLVFTKYTGSTGGKYLSVALVVGDDKVANLLYAGSVTEKRELGFNHLMQWEAIKHAKKLGFEIYNFGGIYENGYGKPGLQGVTNFKKRFGGFPKFHGDFLDMPIKKFRYFIYILRKLI